MALVEEHPIARSGAVMFVYDHHLMLWGGMTQVVLGEGEDRFNIEVNLPGVCVLNDLYYQVSVKFEDLCP